MCTMLVVLFYLHQQKENYRMMGAFTKKSLVKVESKRKRKKNLGFNGLIALCLILVFGTLKVSFNFFHFILFCFVRPPTTLTGKVYTYIFFASPHKCIDTQKESQKETGHRTGTFPARDAGTTRDAGKVWRLR